MDTILNCWILRALDRGTVVPAEAARREVRRMIKEHKRKPRSKGTAKSRIIARRIVRGF